MAAPVRSEELRESARSAFAHYDADSSGAIDARELRSLVASLGGYLTDRELDTALHDLDKDGNGVIEEDEFVSWWTAASGDLDGDGEVCERERALDRVKLAGQEKFRVDVHVASWQGKVDVVRRLIEADGELVHLVDSTEFGLANTPLHYAAYRGHHAICSMLLAAGAKINATNIQGCSPLFLAAQQSNKAVVELLIEHGADLRISEKQHQLTAVDVCTSDEILAIFRARAGGVPGAPLPPTIRRVEDRSIVVGWITPQERHDQVAPVSGYKVRAVQTKHSNSAASASKAVLVEANPTECTLIDLEPATEYTVQVAAFNIHGIGPFSASVPTTTLGARPQPPANIIGHSSEDGTVKLQWTASGPGLRYVVQQCVDDKADLWKRVVSVADGECHATVPGLFADRKYRFRVAAVSGAARQSDYSTPVWVRTASEEVKASPRDPAVATLKPRGEWNRAADKIKTMVPVASSKRSDPQGPKTRSSSRAAAPTRDETAVRAEPKASRSSELMTQDVSDQQRKEGDRRCERVEEKKKTPRQADESNRSPPSSSDEEEHVYFSDASDHE